MSDLSFEAQAATLADIQRRHASELLAHGIAQRALSRRSDEDWYADAATTVSPVESLPVVMLDDSQPARHSLHLYFLQGISRAGVSGMEVNVADIVYPGTGREEIVPFEGFTIEDAEAVQMLAGELLARKQSDLPNISSDLLAIYEPRERP